LNFPGFFYAQNFPALQSSHKLWELCHVLWVSDATRSQVSEHDFGRSNLVVQTLCRPINPFAKTGQFATIRGFLPQCDVNPAITKSLRQQAREKMKIADDAVVITNVGKRLIALQR
jgi:hypothetical protein